MKALGLWKLITFMAELTGADMLIVQHPTKAYIGFGGLVGCGVIYGTIRAGTASFTAPFRLLGVIKFFRIPIVFTIIFLVLMIILMWSR